MWCRSVERNDLLVRARAATLSADLPKVLRSAATDNGYILQLLGTFLEFRDGLVESAVLADISTEEKRHQAVLLRGQVQGIDTCIDLVWRLMHSNPAEENNDA